MSNKEGTGRQILSLAVPAFFALIAEPLFLLADSAIIGHLGTDSLAGLGVASVVLTTATGLFVFLVYATTASVSRAIGAGERARAVSLGLDGSWLGLAIGLVVAVVLWPARGWLIAGLGAQGAAAEQADRYLVIALAGLPAMMLMMALTGAIRGVQDTRTPLLVSVAGFALNLVLNVCFVYGLGWGIGGSAWGTVIATLFMAGWLALVWLRAVRQERVSLRPHPGRVLRVASDGLPLLMRTIALRFVLVLTAWVAAGLGVTVLAAHQVAFTIWSFLAFALDALAVAAQALTGHALGASDVMAVRQATAIMIRWGVWGGGVVGVLVVSLAWVLPVLFTPDPAVRSALTAALIVIGLSQALSGFVFVLDGVLIGAGDGRWLAVGMTVVAAAYVPICLAVRGLGEWLSSFGAPIAMAGLWLAFVAFMAVRAVMLGMRARGDGWLVTGVTR